jgi:hypothetical protein
MRQATLDLQYRALTRSFQYWEQGYYWQEETIERFWCLQCEGSACQNGDEVEIRTCDSDNTYWNFVPNGSGQVQFRIANTNLCLQHEDQRRIVVRNCDSSYSRQFFGPGNGAFGGSRFEIVTPATGGCVSQQHHPKSGENIFSMPCETARKYDTSFWVKY